MKTTAFNLSVLVALALAGCLPREGVSTDDGGGSGGFFPPSSGTGGNSGCFAGAIGPSGGTSDRGGSTGTGAAAFGFAQPQYGSTITREVAPPPISGGTLLVLHDGHPAFAADPDRDQVSVVDLTARTVKARISLNSGDEPGRAVEDAAGRVHVALRRGGAVVTLQPPAWTVTDRQAVCPAPRGLAFDAKLDRVHVACAGGQLVSLPAAGGPPARSLTLDRDLRDVVVDGDHLVVSRFRSAQLLTLDAAGAITQRLIPPAFRSFEARNNQTFSASVAWRTVGMPGGGYAVVHQRGLVDEVPPQAGGYGSFNPCDAIVQTAVLVTKSGTMPRSVPAIPAMVLPVDMAVSPDGKRVALIAAGNATNASQPGGAPSMPRVFAADVSDVSDESVGCRPDGTHGPCQGMFSGPPIAVDGGIFGEGATGGAAGGGGSSDGGVGMMSAGSSGPAMGGSAGVGGSTVTPDPGPARPPEFCSPTGAAHAGELPNPTGEPIAVAYDGDGKVLVQTREPATLSLASGATIMLSPDSREDTGHTIFHSNAGAFVACASCHAEGAEDGRTWNFACEGERRTQSLGAGISGTEPFHWNGDMKSFPQLIDNVFVGRMSGPKLAPEQVTATLRWIDHQPRVPTAAPADPAAVDRGRALFNDKGVSCASCHAGDKFTNNMSADVGTGTSAEIGMGEMFQVPSLLNVSARAPFMHDGCALTLADRFGPCGGGDKHGVTSTLSKAQLADLVAFLESL